MRKTILILMVLSLFSLLINILNVQWDKSFMKNNSIALIGILASACSFLLLYILNTSLKISNKKKKN
ncbi:MAG: hypothetical protein CMC79_03430 [Flavobacteriaceae bacterium]|nr:hypothetical protein [Flavobacteriaceae bacterium]|tara:strand:+ start:27724 stop:27924 length:201 start_codon:yes stop_codon:yes gene_type:complete